jgi:hypothetical protein
MVRTHRRDSTLLIMPAFDRRSVYGGMGYVAGLSLRRHRSGALVRRGAPARCVASFFIHDRFLRRGGLLGCFPFLSLLGFVPPRQVVRAGHARHHSAGCRRSYRSLHRHCPRWLPKSVMIRRKPSNQSMERTATRRAFTFCVARTSSLRSTRAIGGRRSSLPR